MGEPVRVEVDGRIATVTIDRPQARNAIDPETSRALNAAFVALDDGDCWRLAGAAWEAVLASEDAREGPRAFAERRAPVWSGR